jgi:hypothetical protein
MAAPMATLLAVVALAVLSGCGDDERDGVERYIERANAIQARFAPEFRQANDAYARFVRGELDAARADTELSAAERALRDAEAQLARVEPPPIARRLHRQLLRVFDLNAEFASDSTALARYLPAARAVLTRVGAAGQTLSDRIGDAETPARQAAALAGYSRAINRRYDALHALQPPPVLEATHRSQLLRLEASSRLARRLRDATEARDTRRVARLVLQFREVSRHSGQSARLTRRAVREYNERYGALGDAAAAMQREQRRLEQRLD